MANSSWIWQTIRSKGGITLGCGGILKMPMSLVECGIQSIDVSRCDVQYGDRRHRKWKECVCRSLLSNSVFHIEEDPTSGVLSLGGPKKGSMYTKRAGEHIGSCKRVCEGAHSELFCRIYLCLFLLVAAACALWLCCAVRWDARTTQWIMLEFGGLFPVTWSLGSFLQTTT